MSRVFSLLLSACIVSGCAPVPGVPDDADLRAERLAELGLEVCAEVDAELASADAEALDSKVDATEAADADLACATCGCDCSQATCATAGCVAQATGAGDCKQNGSSCNGTTCDCDCYTVLGAACPAPGQGNRSPERIKLTNGVNGVTAACAWK
jgi:hypothetical protein